MKKLKLKKIWLIILLSFVVVFAYPTIQTIRITSNNYSISTAIKILTKGLKDIALENKYSKTFEVAVDSEYFQKNNVKEYIDIDYYNQKDFIPNINALLKKGYTTTDINLINKKFNQDDLENILNKDLIKDISKYLEFDFFKSKNLDRYLKYHKDNYKETIVNVNIGLDKEFYTDAKVIKDFNINVLANKYNKLDESFEPTDLEKIKSSCSKNTSSLSKEAKEAFEKMCDDARKENKFILSNSAYRSYKEQKDLYNTYLKLYGQTYVNNYVATPGFSEHQTGLAIDVASKNSSIFANSEEYKWMIDNSYKYGFILRYPKGKEKITGYKNESWHFRYVGIEAAKYIKENNITYDEYYVMFIEK